jgi:hypothetical protein
MVWHFNDILANYDVLRWLHRQFIHFDANFRLTLERRDNRAEKGVSLWGSDGYFADTNQYQRYLATTKSLQREVRSRLSI